MATVKSSPKTEKAADKKAKSKPDHPKYMYGLYILQC